MILSCYLSYQNLIFGFFPVHLNKFVADKLANFLTLDYHQYWQKDLSCWAQKNDNFLELLTI